MDSGLFWGMAILSLLLTFLPLLLRGPKFALISLFGFFIATGTANQLSADGSVAVGYSSNAGVVTNITNPDSLPVELLVFLAIFALIVTIAKALKQI